MNEDTCFGERIEIELCGIPITCDIDDQVLFRSLARMLRYFRVLHVRCPQFTCHIRGHGPYVITFDTCTPMAVRDQSSVKEVVHSQITSRITGMLGEKYIQLHAGAVSVPGLGIVGFTGPGGSGKSTLTASLLAYGAGFLTDDNLLIRRDSAAGTYLADPYPFPIYLLPDSRRLLEDSLPDYGTEFAWSAHGVKYEFDVSSIRPDVVAASGAIKQLFLIAGKAETPAIEEMSAYDAIVHIPRHSSMWMDGPPRATWEFTDILSHVKCHRLVLGKPGPTAERVLEWVGDNGLREHGE